MESFGALVFDVPYISNCVIIFNFFFNIQISYDVDMFKDYFKTSFLFRSIHMKFRVFAF